MSGGTRTYVGFGFGAIQAGLFLCEAQRSGAFGRLVVAEVQPEVVAAVRRAGGRFAVNVAHADHVETVEIGPVEIFDPAVAADREQLVAAVASAEELGTAVPAVRHYVSAGPASLHRVLADGLRRKATGRGPRAVVYAAENHNQAAELLEADVRGALPEADRQAVREQVRFLNTVIGKMSGAITDPVELRARRLAEIMPGAGRAFLVESFNRILISRIEFPAAAGQRPFRRGLAVFEEKADLLPFEEAKLYGHNATHALAAYLGALRGVRRMADLAGVPGMMPFLRAAFIEESGAALLRKHRGADELFTPAGYGRYADDLLQRMTNPLLCDTVERVARHPERKLGWADRLIGTLRLVLSQGGQPRRYALGAAAALARLEPSWLDDPSAARAPLIGLWGDAAPAGPEKEAALDLVTDGLMRLRAWRAAGFPPCDQLVGPAD